MRVPWTMACYAIPVARESRRCRMTREEWPQWIRDVDVGKWRSRLATWTAVKKGENGTIFARCLSMVLCYLPTRRRFDAELITDVARRIQVPKPNMVIMEDTYEANRYWLYVLVKKQDLYDGTAGEDVLAAYLKMDEEV